MSAGHLLMDAFFYKFWIKKEELENYTNYTFNTQEHTQQLVEQQPYNKKRLRDSSCCELLLGLRNFGSHQHQPRKVNIMSRSVSCIANLDSIDALEMAATSKSAIFKEKYV